MDNFKKLFFLGLFSIILFSPVVARAEWCFCGTDKSLLTSETMSTAKSECVEVADQAGCTAMQTAENKLICKYLSGGADSGKQACADEVTKYNADKDKEKEVSTGFRGVSSKLIPECLLKNNLSSECRDVSIFVYFLIQLARYLFGIIGALALLMFVYGGFTMILSQGNSEKVKKGTEILVAATIGLIIMFGAYMLVSFLGEAVNIQSEFKLTS